jgi:GT2 family glycosyltransferase
MQMLPDAVRLDQNRLGTPDLSIIIINFNAEELILRCLQAVYNTIGSLDCEVIVVDNASTDDSINVVRKAYPQVRLFCNQENIGFARANNQALQVARGQYFLLLNSDAFVHEGAIVTLIKFMESHPDTGAAGCRLVYEDGSLQRSCYSFPTPITELWQTLWLDRLFARSPVFGKFRMTYWDFNSDRDVDWVMGAVMILRKEAIDQVGLLDEEYFMYSEEMDLCYRLKQAGWKVSFVSEATATHLWGGTSRQNKELAFIRLYKSRVMFSRKHYGYLTTILYKMVLFAGSLIRVLGGAIAGLFRKNEEIQYGTRNYWVLLRLLRTI